MAIQLWMRQSEAIFHRKSHKTSLPARPSRNGLLEISEENIDDLIEKRRIVMPHGGWYLISPSEWNLQLIHI